METKDNIRLLNLLDSLTTDLRFAYKRMERIIDVLKGLENITDDEDLLKSVRENLKKINKSKTRLVMLYSNLEKKRESILQKNKKEG